VRDGLDILVGSSYGPIAGQTARKHGTVTAKRPPRRPTPPAGTAAAYWREIYSRVEALWSQLPTPDKNAWRYGWKPRHQSPRDYFSRWNINLVGRYDRYVKTPPARHLERGLFIDETTAVPVPAEILHGPCPWTFNAGTPGVISNPLGRSATRAAFALPGAWTAAFAAVAAAPWIPVPGTRPSNYGYVDWYSGKYYVTAYQSFATVTFPATDARVWRAPTFYYRIAHTAASHYCGHYAGCRKIVQAAGVDVLQPAPDNINLRAAVEWRLADADAWSPPPCPPPGVDCCGYRGVEAYLMYTWR
jgi:hypothetical protein